MLQQAYDARVMEKFQVCDWQTRFHNGRETVTQQRKKIEQFHGRWQKCRSCTRGEFSRKFS